MIFLLIQTIFFHPRSPTERAWTYKCVNARCVRQHYANRNEKRITFPTCSMLCGTHTKIWPEPTKSYIGTSANSFNLNDVQFKIKTPFKNVESLLEGAFSIFLEEIKDISHSSERKTEEVYKSSTTTTYNKEQHSSLENKKYTTSRRHNLTTVNIFLNVIKTSDIHLTLNTDECYNVTMISEYLTC